MEITLGYVIAAKVIAGMIAGLSPFIAGFLLGERKQGQRWFWLCFMLSLIDFIAAFLVGVGIALRMYIQQRTRK